MPRFFLDILNGHGEISDEEGLDLPDQSAAVAVALDSIRSMISEDARSGTIDLTGVITIRDENRAGLETVAYADAFELRLPARMQG